MKIILASSNQHKLSEVEAIMNSSGILVETIPEELRNIPSPEENGSSFRENALIKALYYSVRIPDNLILADDSGLCVQALNNSPGIHSSRYAGENATDQENNLKLLTEMKNIENRNAAFCCSMVVVKDSKLLHESYGEVNGKILKELKGAQGFGYDPLFYYPPLNKTFAELKASEKNSLSHRNRALKDLSQKIFQSLT